MDRSYLRIVRTPQLDLEYRLRFLGEKIKIGDYEYTVSCIYVDETYLQLDLVEVN